MKLLIILLCILSLALSGCATVYNPATGQRELIFVTTPAEVSMGNIVAAKIAKNFKISNDAEKLKRIRETGKRIAEVSDRKDLVYHFNLIEDDDLNAFTSPGGHVYINSGVLEKATDDELACVIGHEVGHIAARHIAKKLQAQIGYDILMSIAMSKAGGTAELHKAASISYDLIMLGYSRQDEMLADRLGVKYAHKAGYDPYAMVSFLKKLKASNKNEMGFIFLRSHPYISDRIKMMERQIPAIIGDIDKGHTAVARTQKQGIPDQGAVVPNKKRPRRVMCPVCRKIFTGSTNYCPYDGTKLEGGGVYDGNRYR